jgi:hypothetical protein
MTTTSDTNIKTYTPISKNEIIKEYIFVPERVG